MSKDGERSRALIDAYDDCLAEVVAHVQAGAWEAAARAKRDAAAALDDLIAFNTQYGAE